ncbi:MAG: (d)CMP kinase [Clostridiaceae bacterium]|nr:(d)CMP kinase [Clostridiaceae bacterium]
MDNIQIVIDGPAGAGKSTISKIVAEQLGFLYIDTGAMYRAVGLKALSLNYDTKNDSNLIAQLMDNIKIDLKHGDNGQQVFLDDKNVTAEIRTPEVSIAASDVSAIPAVRISLANIQRKLAKQNNIVMDGRDIGSYVLPNADIKIFLTASLEDRAKRRYNELLKKGKDVSFENVLSDMNYRDTNDSNRELAPLVVPDGAIVIDTTGNTLEQSIKLLSDTIKERLNCLLK